MSIQLLTTAFATGAQQAVPSPTHNFKSHLWTLYAYGTWGTPATFKLEVSPDAMSIAAASSTWFTVANTTFTANGMINIEGRFLKVRGNLASGVDGVDIITAVLV